MSSTHFTTPCPDDAVLIELLDGTLDEHRTRAIQSHLDECASCRDFFADLSALMCSMSEEKKAGGGDQVSMIGRYEVRARLGAGAMGVVYRAWDSALHREVALKILRPDRVDASGTKGEAIERLMREARACASLQHPHVVPVYDVGRWREDNVFVASALIEGEVARTWCKAKPWQDVLRVYIQIVQALGAAHRAGLIHRDVKPDNIIVDETGHAYLLDFGLVHAFTVREDEPEQASSALSLTMTGAVVGTPAYMSPEQLDGQQVDAQADLYALCVSLYEAIYGFRPYSGHSLSALIAARREPIAVPPSHDVPRQLSRVLERALRARASERYADAAELEEALVFVGTPRRFVPVVASCLVALVLAAIGVGLFHARKAPDRVSDHRSALLAVSHDRATQPVKRPAPDVPQDLSTAVVNDEIVETEDPGIESEALEPVVVARQVEEVESRRKREKPGAMRAVTKKTPPWMPGLGPDALALSEACMKASSCDLKPACIDTVLDYIKRAPIEHPRGREDHDALAIYASSNQAISCAYSARRCEDVSAIFWEIYPDRMRSGHESERDYELARAAQYGSLYPECPIGSARIDSPELEVEQLESALAKLSRAPGGTQSCIDAWTRFMPHIDELLEQSPAHADELDYELEALTRCLAPTHCDMAREVWSRLAAIDPDELSRDSFERYDSAEGHFAYEYHACGIPPHASERVRVSWAFAILDEVLQEKTSEACARGWRQVEAIVSNVDTQQVDIRLRIRMAQRLAPLATCVASGDCVRAREIWHESQRFDVHARHTDLYSVMSKTCADEP